MDEKEIEYLQSVLKIPSVGARGVNAIYEHLKKEGKAYNNKTKTGFTLTKIKEWYNTRERECKRINAIRVIIVLYQSAQNNNFN